MDLKHLEIFHEICRNKSFSNAAKKLRISQPTVSTHIKSLEENIGLTLFNRKNKTTGNLTEAGEILYQFTRQIFSLMDKAEASLKHYKQGTYGVLSLATAHTFCNWYLPEIIESFKQKYPTVEIVLHTDFTPRTMDLVDSREVQFGITRSASPVFLDKNFKSLLIGSDHAVFVVSPNHRLVQYKNVYVKDIINEAFIAFGNKSNYWEQVLNYFDQIGVHPKVTMELHDIQAVKKMIEINMGISILPLISIQDELKAGTLKVIKVNDFPKMIRYSHLIYKKDLIRTGPTEKFYEFIKETMPYSFPFDNI